MNIQPAPPTTLPAPKDVILSVPSMFDIYVDITSRRALQNMNATSPRTSPFIFYYNDLLGGTLRLLQESGLTTPIFYRLTPVASSGISLTDGLGLTYAAATAVTLVGTGDVGDPRLTFTFDLGPSATALVTAMQALPPETAFL